MLFGSEPPAALSIAPDGSIFAASKLANPFTGAIVQSDLTHLDVDGNTISGFGLPNELTGMLARANGVLDLVMRNAPVSGVGTTTIEVQQYKDGWLPDFSFNPTSTTPGVAGYTLTTSTLDVGATTLDPAGKVVFGGAITSAPGDAAPWLTRLHTGLQPFVAAAPVRLLDTRSGGITVDGLFAGGGKLLRGTRLALTIGGRARIPANVSSVVLNVTVTAPTAAGFLTVYPCTATVPTASNVNFAKNQTVANSVVVSTAQLLAASVCLYASQTTDVIVDAASHFDTPATFTSITPARLMETRSRLTTVDGLYNGIGVRRAGSVTELQVAGRAGVPLGAAAAVLNVTSTESIADGFVTVYDCDSGLPTASNVNFAAGQTTPNLVIAKLSARGTVCLYTNATTHLLADVSGAFHDLQVYRPLTPARLMDTRSGLSTVDDLYNGIGVRDARAVTELQIAGRGGVPFGASSVVMNVTVTEPSADGYVTVFPCGGAVPTTSNVNFVAGQTIPNAVVAALTPTGTVCIYTHTSTHLLVDVSGYFP